MTTLAARGCRRRTPLAVAARAAAQSPPLMPFAIITRSAADVCRMPPSELPAVLKESRILHLPPRPCRSLAARASFAKKRRSFSITLSRRLETPISHDFAITIVSDECIFALIYFSRRASMIAFQHRGDYFVPRFLFTMPTHAIIFALLAAYISARQPRRRKMPR